MRQILSVLLSFTLTFSQGFYPALILAQEATESAIEATESAQTASPEPTAEPSPSPSSEPSPPSEPTPSPEASPLPSPLPLVSRFNFAPFTDSKKVKSGVEDSWVKGEILVKFKEDSLDLDKSEGRAQAWEFAEARGFEIVRHLKSANITVLKLRNDSLVPSKIEQLQKEGAIVFAERNFKRKLSSINTNDPLRDELWGLHNTGQTVGYNEGVEDADIDAPEAWEIAEGKPETIVAVIDTGVDYNHPDLVGAMWDGTNCKDEDGSFLGGCKHGYDFSQNDEDPFPSFGEFGFTASHGTHVAGTIAATKNNGKGIIGVAPGVKVMALKVDFSLDSLVRATDFARANGAKVINASYHSYGYSQAERESIERFIKAGGLFIASAGNSYSDSDTENGQYPAKYPLDGIVSVAATDNRDNKAFFSNWGAKTVDIGAPGVAILSAVVDFVYKELIAETFNIVTTQSLQSLLPSGWTSVGNWQIVDTQNPAWGNVLYPDTIPYSANANSTFTSPKLNLTDGLTADVTFFARCDTEYKPEKTDFLEFQVSGDGVNFETFNSLDEYSIDRDGDESNNITPPTIFVWQSIPESYLTSDFQVRFKWTTNDTDNNHEGCSVDDIYISKITQGNGEKYELWSGTSMAAPHVSGLAALLWSAKSDLTFSQVKSIILSTGDPIPALAGKTLTGKRINAAKALQVVKGPGILGVTDDPSPVRSKTWNWYSDDAAASFRFVVDQNPAGVPTGAYGDIKTTTVNSGDGAFYLHVQAKANGIEGNVVTVYAIIDNTAPSESQLVPISVPISTVPTTVPISSPGEFFTGSLVWTAVGDVSGVAHYIVEVVNETTGQVYTDAVMWTTSVFNYFIFLWDGIWSIFVTAEDNAGNTVNVLSQTVVVDTIAPTGLITKPVNGSHHNTLPDLSADIQDSSGSGVQYVNFWLRAPEAVVVSGAGGGGVDASGSAVVATDYTAPYETTNWDETWGRPTPEGLYNVWAEAVDNFGNRSVTPAVGFTYDTTKPVAPKVENPGAPVTVNANIYKIEGVKAEFETRVKVYVGENVVAEEVEVSTSTPESVRGGGTVPQCSFSSLQGGGGLVPWAVTVTLQQNAVNNFTVTSTDCAGNESGHATVPTITEDSNAPEITSYTLDNAVISPSSTPGVRDTASFDLAFSEEVAVDFDILNSGGAKVKDVYTSPAVTNPQAKTWDGKNNSGSFVTDGVYTIKIAITDSVGNNLTDTSKTITVDNDTLSLVITGDKTIGEGEELKVTLIGSDEEGNILVYGVINAPEGSLLNSSTGIFTWTPSEAQGPGVYDVIFTVTNGFETVSQNTSFIVREHNQSPVADNVAVSTDEDTNLTITLTGSDADLPANTLTFSLVSTPTNGILSALDDNNQVVYTPNINFNGKDSFVFKVSDGNTKDTMAVVSITVNPVNDAPTAVADTITTIKNTTIVVPVSTLLVNDSDIEGDQLSFVTVAYPTNGTVIVNGSNIEFTPTTDFVGLGSFLYAVSDGAYNETGVVTVVVNPTPEQDEVIMEPVTDVTPTAPDIVVGPSEEDAIVNIPANVTNAVLDLFSGLVETIVGSQIEVTIPADITLNVASSAGNIIIEMPRDVTVSAPTGWNGEISAPKLESNNTVTVIAPGGLVNTTTAVIEVGAGDTALTFNKAVRIVVPAQAGKLAAWVRAGVITEIANTCSADTQISGDALPAGGECKTNAGSDLVIWTKHFTKFVAFTQTTQAAQVPASTSVGSGSASSPAPSCSDTKPGSAPKLLSAQITGSGEVTLTWAHAADPATYYLVAYGNKSGEVKYGNPNVGGRDTVRYTVRGLSTGTYYFRVRAGNGCTPGDFSNELASSFGGQLTPIGSEPAEGFTEGVLGETTDVEADTRAGKVKADETKTETPEVRGESVIAKVAGNPLFWVVLAFVLAGAGLYLLTRPKE
ncbi:MAG: Cna protein B-type protein [Microgenomates group bacterium Gr01-1014_5]|nr:MAG: Cna protein B-type protein [Microgenomates group bacterium Gr01-1014_5]